MRRRVINLAGLDVRGVAELHAMIGEAFAASALATISEAGLSPGDIDLIGSHGQTIYHHSGVDGAIRARSKSAMATSSRSGRVAT